MYFIDEQNIVRFKIGEHRGQIAGAFQHGAGGVLQVHAHFTGNDVRESGLAQARRTE